MNIMDRFTDKPTAPAVENNDANLLAIATACKALGVKSASPEHPACVYVEECDSSWPNLKGFMVIGNVNGPWAVDVFENVDDFLDGQQPIRSKDVGPYHVTTPEGIARFAVGLMRQDHGLLAYASRREQQKMDRPTRSGRR